NNSLQWKNFDLNVFLIGYHGFDIYNYPAARLTSQLAPTPALADRWVAGSNEDAKIASFGPNRDAITSYEQVASSTFVEKGDFVKIKSVTLGYNFTDKALKSVGIDAARVYISAKNLATFTGNSGNDPEMAISNPLRPGLDAGVYPAQTSFILGVNLTF
ncbi:MAG: SusC/RagA family TonB-linked outer membrane protein, partial [Tidjanibacter sp.]|nr:SusC/RagA family TonB-linked outer membrane protein [Tidjanibacter sp.]